MEENKIYTASDFERYYNGTMSEEEMYALEMAAWNDPFLGDALEGYMHSSAAAKDVAGLRSRLHEKFERKKTFLLFSTTGWWRIAALFFLIGGAGYLTYVLNRNEQTNNLALKGDKKELQEKKQVAPSADTMGLNDVVSVNQSSAKDERSKRVYHHEVANNKYSYHIRNKVIARPDTISVNTKLLSINDEASPAENFSKNNLTNKFFLKGKVVDDKGHPLTTAVVREKISKIANVTDDNGNFSLNTNDSSELALVSAPGYKTKEVKLEKDTAATIALSPLQNTFDEVVIAGYGKNINSSGKNLRGAKVTDNITTDSIGDDVKFNQYIITHRKTLYDSNNTLLTGNVTLSFTVDGDGLPEDIMVIRSTCKGCEDNAIELVKKSPAWSNKKMKKTVIISY